MGIAAGTFLAEKVAIIFSPRSKSSVSARSAGGKPGFLDSRRVKTVRHVAHIIGKGCELLSQLLKLASGDVRFAGNRALNFIAIDLECGEALAHIVVQLPGNPAPLVF